jgi:hypothetical protein
MFRRVLFFVFLINYFQSFEQVYDGTYKIKKQNPKAAGCSPPTTTTYMELNNVRAMVHTAGNLWQVPNRESTPYLQQHYG